VANLVPVRKKNGEIRLCVETFQRAMDIPFVGEKDKSVVIYLDDITIFSRYDKEHYHHLKKVFLKCRRFGLSLNPKKSLFVMKEGNYWEILCQLKG
jgi:hypothetical protein